VGGGGAHGRSGYEVSSLSSCSPDPDPNPNPNPNPNQVSSLSSVGLGQQAACGPAGAGAGVGVGVGAELAAPSWPSAHPSAHREPPRAAAPALAALAAVVSCGEGELGGPRAPDGGELGAPAAEAVSSDGGVEHTGAGALVDASA